MSLWKIAWRSIQQRSLASALTGLSMALGVALVATVLVIHAVIERSFDRGAQGYDLIVGPKGSPLQLALSVVYHIGDPVGRIPLDDYYRIRDENFHLPDGRRVPRPELAIPICVGGNYQGYPLLGTTLDFFTLVLPDGEHYQFAPNGGQGENMTSHGYYEAVIGPTVARDTGLEVGDTFRPRHGRQKDQGEEHRPFTVVGIFAPTGTPNDRALFVNIEGFWRIHEHGHDEDDSPETAKDEETGEHEHADDHDHEHEHEHAKSEHAAEADKDGHEHGAEKDAERHADGDHEHEHDHDHEQGRHVSAILLVLDESDPSLMMIVPRLIGDIPGLQAIHPAAEISKLLEGIVGNIQWVLLILAILVVVVAGIGILVSIYNSMNDRRHDIAVMRALGASRMNVMLIILMESILLSLGGGAVGLVLAHGLIALLGPTIAEHTGVVVGALQFHVTELILIPGLIALASLVGYLPAVVAYRTDVAKSLAASA